MDKLTHVCLVFNQRSSLKTISKIANSIRYSGKVEVSILIESGSNFESFSLVDMGITSVSRDFDLVFIFSRCSMKAIVAKLNANYYVSSNYKIARSQSLSSLVPVLLRRATSPFVVSVIPHKTHQSMSYVLGRLQTSAEWSTNDNIQQRTVLFFFHQLLAEYQSGKPLNLNYFDKNVHQENSLSAVDLARMLANGLYFPSLRILIRILNKLKKKLGIRTLEPEWRIAFTHSGIIKDDDIVVKKIQNPKTTFLADPFIVTESTQTTIFVEEFDKYKQRAHISAIELNGETASAPFPVLIEDFHLSFPFVFKFADTYYMCPETSRIGEIRLYRATKYPHEWVFDRTIMQGVSAADTIIFQKNGKWWLFTNIDRIGLGTHNLELHIFFSDNPLDENWLPHPKNPVYLDTSVARNGGILFSEGEVYRVAQIQGFNRYGEGVSIRLIKELNPENFVETEVRRFVKDFSRKSKGNHHLSSCGGITVLDYFQ